MDQRRFHASRSFARNCSTVCGSGCTPMPICSPRCTVASNSLYAKRKVLVIGKRIGKTSMFSIVLIDLLLLVRGDQLHDSRRGLPQRLNPVELFDLSPRIYRCP